MSDLQKLALEAAEAEAARKARPADGGPAFPVAYWDRDQMRFVNDGMSLRDHFAEAAMPLAMRRVEQHYRSEIGRLIWTDDDWESIAQHAYKMADAMLKAREQ